MQYLHQFEAAERRWAALALIITAQFMVILDVAVVNVALPSIQTDLHFSQAGLQWVISAYAILFGGVLLLGGRLADLLGRRRLFVAGLALFSVSSLLCGIAWSEGSLVAFRAVQGLGGALLAPAALSLLMTTFREGRERNLALGIYGAASGSGAAAGVLLGGVLTSYLSWSWIFFVNVPVGVIAIALTPWLLRESRAELDHRHFDVAGATTVTAGLMLLVYAMTRATTDGWGSASTLGLIGASARADRARSSRSSSARRRPLLPLAHLPCRGTLVAANVTMAIVGAVAFSEFFLLTLYLQDVLHYSPMQSGVAFTAFALTVVVISNVAQWIVGRAGVRATLTAGLLSSAASVALLTRLPLHGRYFWDMFPAFVLGGAGMALSFVPVTIASLTGVQALRRGHRVGSREHEPSDRRGDRARCGERDRRELVEQLPPFARGRRARCGARPRHPDVALRADRVARRGRADRGAARQTAAAARAGRGRARARAAPAGRGRLMETLQLQPESSALLGREIDDLLLEVRGLALVRDLLAERGASAAEIAAHTSALEGARARLAERIRP